MTNILLRDKALNESIQICENVSSSLIFLKDYYIYYYLLILTWGLRDSTKREAATKKGVLILNKGLRHLCITVLDLKIFYPEPTAFFIALLVIKKNNF